MSEIDGIIGVFLAELKKKIKLAEMWQKRNSLSLIGDEVGPFTERAI